jgi:hypothetical protein
MILESRKVSGLSVGQIIEKWSVNVGDCPNCSRYGSFAGCCGPGNDTSGLLFKWEFSYMLVSRHQNAVQNRDIEIANRSFENVSQFKYLGTTVTNQI